MVASSAGTLLLRSLFGTPAKAGDGTVKPATVPLAAHIFSMCLSLITLPVLGVCLTRRIERIHKWSRLPVSAWLLLTIYVDSFLFIFATALFKDIGTNKSADLCEGAILLCLVCYMSTKVLIYTFLVEKAWVVRGRLHRRKESKLYLFNCFGMLLPYGICVVLNFLWRISFINTHGTCIIGIQIKALMALIVFEVIVNIYLNILFIIPLRKLYSYRHGNGNMRRLAFRAFIGSCTTLLSSVVNLSVLMSVGGEPGWICLMLCNLDILFCGLVLHWVTAFDSNGSFPQAHGPRPACSCSAPGASNMTGSTAVGALVSNATCQVPDPVYAQRKQRCSDEDFPESCWKAHPWDMAGLPPSCGGPQAAQTAPDGAPSSSCETSPGGKKEQEDLRGDSVTEVDETERIEMELGERGCTHGEGDRIEKCEV
ncbi:ring finger domain [Lecanosticta acicola]|uniref:Ring finger domain n=1 Tax=Lecanosticta acicola TaxID=111012 RepID=A0AAI8YTA7_9PEZI|nr:ring finger domain [Lecanosticta acicola]